MKKKKSGVSCKGISNKGSGKYLGTKTMFDDVRRRLNLDEKELPNKVIKQIIRLSNKEIAQWIIDNPEGYMLKDMGVLAASKHLPKELREQKEETIEKLKLMDISEHKRKVYLRRYDVDIGRRIDMEKLNSIQKLIPHLNLLTFFYTYKVMWFNHRNCKIKKASCYTFQFAASGNKKFHEKIMDGRDYYEFNFNDHYRYKLKPTL